MLSEVTSLGKRPWYAAFRADYFEGIFHAALDALIADHLEIRKMTSDKAEALAVLGEVHAAVANWRRVALSAEVGLRTADLDDFATAFEHEQMEAATVLLGL